MLVLACGQSGAPLRIERERAGRIWRRVDWLKKPTHDVGHAMVGRAGDNLGEPVVSGGAGQLNAVRVGSFEGLRQIALDD